MTFSAIALLQHAGTSPATRAGDLDVACLAREPPPDSVLRMFPGTSPRIKHVGLGSLDSEPPKRGLSLRECFLTKSAREGEKDEDKGHSLAKLRVQLKSSLSSIPRGALECLILSGERDCIHILVRNWL